MTPLALYAVDLVAVAVLVLGLYLPRHRRRDLVVAFCGVNVGVLAVSAALSQSTVGAGLGLGLFGVLSIIRLRSTELSQTEVAYYFAALALGLLGGMGGGVPWLAVAGTVAILAVMALADGRLVTARYRTQTIVVDRAFADEAGLVAHLEQILGARVDRVRVQRLDLVNDSTTVEVHIEAARRGTGRRPGSTGRDATADDTGRGSTAQGTGWDAATPDPARPQPPAGPASMPRADVLRAGRPA